MIASLIKFARITSYLLSTFNKPYFNYVLYFFQRYPEIAFYEIL